MAQFESEIEKYRKAIEANPNDLDSMVQLARYLSWSEKYEEAITYFKKVLAVQHDHAEAKVGLATVY
ncbi:MAG: tetratricopeptide repeat protein, partial [Deltaproteobacteria bacterium]